MNILYKKIALSVVALSLTTTAHAGPQNNNDLQTQAAAVQVKAKQADQAAKQTAAYSQQAENAKANAKLVKDQAIENAKKAAETAKENAQAATDKAKENAKMAKNAVKNAAAIQSDIEEDLEQEKKDLVETVQQDLSFFQRHKTIITGVATAIGTALALYVGFKYSAKLRNIFFNKDRALAASQKRFYDTDKELKIANAIISKHKNNSNCQVEDLTDEEKSKIN